MVNVCVSVPGRGGAPPAKSGPQARKGVSLSQGIAVALKVAAEGSTAVDEWIKELKEAAGGKAWKPPQELMLKAIESLRQGAQQQLSDAKAVATKKGKEKDMLIRGELEQADGYVEAAHALLMQALDFPNQERAAAVLSADKLMLMSARAFHETTARIRKRKSGMHPAVARGLAIMSRCNKCGYLLLSNVKHAEPLPPTEEEEPTKGSAAAGRAVVLRPYSAGGEGHAHAASLEGGSAGAGSASFTSSSGSSSSGWDAGMEMMSMTEIDGVDAKMLEAPLLDLITRKPPPRAGGSEITIA